MKRNDGTLQLHDDITGKIKAYGSRNVDTMTSTAYVFRQSSEVITEDEFLRRYDDDGTLLNER